jgi:hypothetical protein
VWGNDATDVTKSQAGRLLYRSFTDELTQSGTLKWRHYQVDLIAGAVPAIPLAAGHVGIESPILPRSDTAAARHLKTTDITYCLLFQQ